ncbi:MAG: hypothetical protein OES79_04790, partial [Planctomycetota bacterium]|nr:hypothetical protein [Planctomycetota bacterium]
MHIGKLSAEADQRLEAVLGYLNFSAGSSDPQFLGHLNETYRLLDSATATIPDTDAAAPCQEIFRLLICKLDDLAAGSETFRDTRQARFVLKQSHEGILPAYRTFHEDLLAHQDDATLFGPFLLGRVYEAVIQCLHRDATQLDDDPCSQPFIDEVLQLLNDYVGYRPVAVLETEQKLEPYPHERCRPLPIYIRGVGAACGRYERLIAKTIEILESTNATLLEQAYFDLARVAELAIDPRAYDFDHPANKRPNYQFGTWDLQRTDDEGYYCRFVVQQVTLDALARRIDEAQDAPPDDLLVESAAALAGTILMASGVCGRGPDTHSSDVSLGNLLPRIAAYRDAFYEQLLVDHANERLIAEAKHSRQPFGGVRQYLNAELSRQR